MLKYGGVKKKKSTGTYLEREEMEQRVCVYVDISQLEFPHPDVLHEGESTTYQRNRAHWGVKHGLFLSHVRLQRWKTVTSGAFLFSSIVSAS